MLRKEVTIGFPQRIGRHIHRFPEQDYRTKKNALIPPCNFKINPITWKWRRYRVYLPGEETSEDENRLPENTNIGRSQ